MPKNRPALLFLHKLKGMGFFTATCKTKISKIT
jgi:hypothetical protein